MTIKKPSGMVLTINGSPINTTQLITSDMQDIVYVNTDGSEAPVKASELISILTTIRTETNNNFDSIINNLFPIGYCYVDFNKSEQCPIAHYVPNSTWLKSEVRMIFDGSTLKVSGNNLSLGVVGKSIFGKIVPTNNLGKPIGTPQAYDDESSRSLVSGASTGITSDRNLSGLEVKMDKDQNSMLVTVWTRVDPQLFHQDPGDEVLYTILT